MILTLALLSGCVVETYDTGYAPGYYRPASSLPYVREPVLVQTPYYVSGGVNYYFVSGQYFYVSRGRRYYVHDLPHRGVYNYQHPYYGQRAAITRTVVHSHSAPPVPPPSLARPTYQPQRVVDHRYQGAPPARVYPQSVPPQSFPRDPSHGVAAPREPRPLPPSMQKSPAQSVPNSTFAGRGSVPKGTSGMAQRAAQPSAPSRPQAAPANPSGSSQPGKRKDKKDENP